MIIYLQIKRALHGSTYIKLCIHHEKEIGLRLLCMLIKGSFFSPSTILIYRIIIQISLSGLDQAWLSLHHFFQETSMLTFTPQKQSNDIQGLKKAIESERNGGERTSTITITMENETFCFYLQ